MANVDAPGATAPTAGWWQDPPVAQKPTDQFGKDTFMKLLVAQLKYQNPMSPADGNEFLAQTAQFSMVEKLEEMNTQTAAIATSQRLMEASNLVGKTVTFFDSDGVEHGGVVVAARLDPSGPILRVGAYEVPLALVESVVVTPQTTATDRDRLQHGYAVPALTLTSPPENSRIEEDHAPLPVLRCLRTPGPPDDDGRCRKQHRQRQHRGLQSPARRCSRTR